MYWILLRWATCYRHSSFDLMKRRKHEGASSYASSAFACGRLADPLTQ